MGKGTGGRRAVEMGGLVALALLGVCPQVARAQEPPAPWTADSVVTVVAGPDYAAGGLHRLLLGAHYRDTWTAPIRVPVLDLRSWAGGLTPTKAHKGSQTTSLRFDGADGREYQFRSVYKTPATGLPAHLQQTVLADLMQDGASASHPLGGLVVARLLGAAGVLRPEPVLSVLPDDARRASSARTSRGCWARSRCARTRRSTGAEVSPAP